MRDAKFFREQSGFTLPEMMVTIIIMLTVFFALHSIFDMSIRVFGFGNDKVEAVENARIGLERMEREIRASYPVDRIGGYPHVFFDAALPLTPTFPGERKITFGNDLATGGPPNRMVDSSEVITYELRSSSNLSNACPTSGTAGICALVRIQNGAVQPVVEYVIPNGLTFQYFKGNLSAADPSGDGTDVGVIRVTLEVNVNQGSENREQKLTTDVDLRNRG